MTEAERVAREEIFSVDAVIAQQVSEEDEVVHPPRPVLSQTPPHSRQDEGLMNEVLQQAKVLRERGYQVSFPEYAQVRHDGNMTVVVLNGKHIGWSKFNPADKVVWTETSKRGKVHVRTKTKYNQRAGLRRAIRRALEVMIRED